MSRLAKGARLKPLWTCPQCGHRFVTRRMWYSCSHYTLADHFADKPRALRELFNHYLSVVRSFGPVTVIAQKTRICFQVGVRFAGAMVRKQWLECAFWLKRRAAHPLIHRVEVLLNKDFVHYFRLTDTAQLDDSLAAMLREAYDVGCQKHLLMGNSKLFRRDEAQGNVVARASRPRGSGLGGHGLFSKTHRRDARATTR